jgi:hypothetical protein
LNIGIVQDLQWETVPRDRLPGTTLGGAQGVHRREAVVDPGNTKMADNATGRSPKVAST